jgi:UDP-N-acetylmuramate--alanine ligase
LKRSGLKQGLLGKTRHVHLVGIGGAGMSAIAEVLLNNGLKVSGSDMSASDVTERLKERGAIVYVGHDEKNITGADVVAHSSAVKPSENAETLAAKVQGVPVIKRDEMLGEIMRRKAGICIAGTHGKTTTTTMIATMLEECNLEPTALIGGVSDYFKGSSLVGEGDYMVIEADEYDRTFLKLTPQLAVMTTLEAEHLDIYKDLDDLKESFTAFANKAPFYGAVVLCHDEENLRAIRPNIKRKVIGYGISADAELQATDIVQSAKTISFSVNQSGKKIGDAKLSAAGLHNVKNALAAIAVGLEVGLAFEDIARGLSKFQSVRRRFQVKYDKERLVIDDYAHHPTEVRATLEAARSGWRERRLVALLQPHLFSRTRDFASDFAEALSVADKIIVAEIYPSREKPEAFAGVSSELITAKCPSAKALPVVAKKNLVQTLLRETKSDDVIVMMGAGDITLLADAFVQRLSDIKQSDSDTKRSN